MGAHARLSPSSASRWTECAQSVAANSFYPEGGSSIHADLGTTVHWAIYEVLTQNLWSSMEMVGKICPDTHMGVTEDMVDAADTMVNYVRKRRDEMGPNTEMHCEVKLNPGALIGREDCKGTSDVVLVNDVEMEIIDYKNGSGVTVEADDPQLPLYGVGGVNEFGRKEIVRTTVVQPRKPHQDGPIRSIRWSDEEMQNWIDFFTEAAAATDDPNAPFSPTEEACRWCNAKAACAAHADFNLRQAQVYFSETPVAEANPKEVLEEIRTNTTQRAPSDLPVEVITTILDATPMIRGWLDAVESYAMALLQGGHDVPGYKLVEGRSNRGWDKDLEPEDLVKKLRNLGLKKPDFIEEKVRSVAQIEKVIKHMDLTERKKKNFEALIYKPPGKVTIAPASDPRASKSIKPTDLFEAVEPQTQE